MNESRISVRYAKALFLSALEKDILDRVNQDMIQVKEISSLPDVKTILADPVTWTDPGKLPFFMACLKRIFINCRWVFLSTLP